MASWMDLHKSPLGDIFHPFPQNPHNCIYMQHGGFSAKLLHLVFQKLKLTKCTPGV